MLEVIFFHFRVNDVFGNFEILASMLFHILILDVRCRDYFDILEYDAICWYYL